MLMATRLHLFGRRCSRIKKPVFPIIMILSGVIAGIIISGILYMFTGFPVFGCTRKANITGNDSANADMTMLAYTVLEYISNDDFSALSRIVHPEYGVVLSPYATINLNTDRQFNAEQIAALSRDTGIYVWGVYNGSGEPIELTPADYFALFVPASDHLDAPVIGINQIVRSGNALENIIEVFPGVKFVDFHIPGGEPVEEFDWSSLRLGFEEYNGELRLVVIVYSKWTV